MSPKTRQQIERRKREAVRRLDRDDNRGCDQPTMTASNIHYEFADRTRATAAGGIGAMHLLYRARADMRHLRQVKFFVGCRRRHGLEGRGIIGKEAVYELAADQFDGR